MFTRDLPTHAVGEHWRLQEQVVTESNRRVSDAHVKGESGSLEDDVPTDKSRRKPASPAKKRRIEHDSSLEVQTEIIFQLGLHLALAMMLQFRGA